MNCEYNHRSRSARSAASPPLPYLATVHPLPLFLHAWGCTFFPKASPVSIQNLPHLLSYLYATVSWSRSDFVYSCSSSIEIAQSSREGGALNSSFCNATPCRLSGPSVATCRPRYPSSPPRTLTICHLAHSVLIGYICRCMRRSSTRAVMVIRSLQTSARPSRR
ncbi:uncharacterized protein SCHCODRAFT_02627439 [Schizophyllum commune H4-8]|uniref:uncharacterized protein n=1 Tax=Schizophyllum commune (strain H4-8 / FGSC 9210) TaxID=578458 RepID=UPI0021609E6D|nr:uncharacterized protein SCHCODRAFT_02627439 [Schizophyllum commune H4-8]KAI5892898.1 hypothetical protein SCHCODRAFT_02627439 [Schizophyllum commune H4-8]